MPFIIFIIAALFSARNGPSSMRLPAGESHWTWDIVGKDVSPAAATRGDIAKSVKTKGSAATQVEQKTRFDVIEVS
jgi:hypothetical protein